MEHSSPLGAGFAGCPLFARAGGAADARAHFRAVAAHDVETLLRGYADDATLRWTGGGLDGQYAGAAQRRTLWRRFAAEHGPLMLVDAEVHDNANPRATTLTAAAHYRTRGGADVRQHVVVRDGKIVSEAWEVEAAVELV